MLWGPRLYWLGKNRWKNNWYQKMGSVCLPQIGILQYISPNKSKITFISLTGLDLQSGRGNPRYTTLVGRFWNANYNNGALSSRLSCIFLQIYPWILIFLIPAFFYLSWGCCYILQQSCPQRKGSFNSKRQLEPSKALTSCPTNQTTWIDTASGTKKKTEEMFGQISSIKSVQFIFGFGALMMALLCSICIQRSIGLVMWLLNSRCDFMVNLTYDSIVEVMLYVSAKWKPIQPQFAKDFKSASLRNVPK